MAEQETDFVREAMAGAENWYLCRVGFVETVRAVGLVAGRRAIAAFAKEWPAFGVIEVDQLLVEQAATLAVNRRLGSLDSLHLAACLLLPLEDVVFATWDRRLHLAAAAEGLQLLPEKLA